MVKSFHPTLYWICDYLSMFRLKSNHVNVGKKHSHMMMCFKYFNREFCLHLYSHYKKVFLDYITISLNSFPPWQKWWLNSFPPGQNGHHFGRWHSQMCFLEWKWQNFGSNFTEICSHCPIDNKVALVQVMAWCQTGDKPQPERMITKFTDA